MFLGSWQSERATILFFLGASKNIDDFPEPLGYWLQIVRHLTGVRGTLNDERHDNVVWGAIATDLNFEGSDPGVEPVPFPFCNVQSVDKVFNLLQMMSDKRFGLRIERDGISFDSTGVSGSNLKNSVIHL